MPGSGVLGTRGRWVAAGVVLTVAASFPVWRAVTAGSSDEPWGARAETWVAQYLAGVGDESGSEPVRKAFYAPDGVLDLRVQSGRVTSGYESLTSSVPDQRHPAVMLDLMESQGWYLAADSVLILFTAPPLPPYVDGAASPGGSPGTLPQGIPRHFASLLELGDRGISTEVDLAAPQTWGSAPRRCDDQAVASLEERYLAAWSSGGSRADVAAAYGDGSEVVDSATGRRVVGVDGILEWADAARSLRGSPKPLALRGAGGRALYVTCDPVRSPDRAVLVLQRLDRRGCPVEYAASLRLGADQRVESETWLTAPSAGRRCAGPGELVDGWWAHVEIPSLVPEDESPPLRRPEQVITLTGATPALADQLDRALDRYEEAGLGVPRVTAVSWVDRDDPACQVVNGLAMSRSPQQFDVTLCFTEGSACADRDCSSYEPWTDEVLLHELAHAWVAQHVDAARRQAYLDHARLREWSAITTAYHLRGVERASWDIAFGLTEHTPRNPPEGERLCRSQDEGFRILTGEAPLTPAC
ncbi:MAG TPA: hypothetical protein VK894_00220 [Jiangellales bacterium]|nr:hypothetical protein [Jiangellales bacterium]